MIQNLPLKPVHDVDVSKILRQKSTFGAWPLQSRDNEAMQGFKIQLAVIALVPSEMSVRNKIKECLV